MDQISPLNLILNCEIKELWVVKGNGEEIGTKKLNRVVVYSYYSIKLLKC